MKKFYPHAIKTMLGQRGSQVLIILPYAGKLTERALEQLAIKLHDFAASKGWESTPRDAFQFLRCVSRCPRVKDVWVEENVVGGIDVIGHGWLSTNYPKDAVAVVE